MESFQKDDSVTTVMNGDELIYIKTIPIENIQLYIGNVNLQDIKCVKFQSNGHMYLMADNYWICVQMTKNHIMNKYTYPDHCYILLAYNGPLKHQFSSSEHLVNGIDMKFTSSCDFDFVNKIT